MRVVAVAVQHLLDELRRHDALLEDRMLEAVAEVQRVDECAQLITHQLLAFAQQPVVRRRQLLGRRMKGDIGDAVARIAVG